MSTASRLASSLALFVLTATAAARPAGAQAQQLWTGMVPFPGTTPLTLELWREPAGPGGGAIPLYWFAGVAPGFRETWGFGFEGWSGSYAYNLGITIPPIGTISLFDVTGTGAFTSAPSQIVFESAHVPSPTQPAGDALITGMISWSGCMTDPVIGPICDADGSPLLLSVTIPALVPEPATLALTAGGVVVLGAMARRRRS